MSLHFFLDGHNLVHTGGRWDHIPRATRRTQMLEDLAKAGLTGSSRNTVTVVFDGFSPRIRLVSPGSFMVVFSGDKDADTVIKERVEALSNGRDAVVVTNDRSIQQHAKKRGARVVSCEEFLAAKAPPTKPSSAEPLDPLTRGKINDELKSIWKIK